MSVRTIEPSRERGFTLIEAVIMVGVIAAVSAIAVPTIGNVSRADLRRASTQVSGNVRAAYDMAALSGQTYRLAFELSKAGGAAQAAPGADPNEGAQSAGRTVRVEASPELLAFDAQANPLARMATGVSGGRMGADAWAALAPEALGEGATDDDDADGEAVSQSPFELLFGKSDEGRGRDAPGVTSFKAAHESLVLPEGVRLSGVWTQGMSQSATEGVAYLYFFPGGYTQRAHIYLEDEEGRAFTVRVFPLTGEVEIVDSYVEVPK